jgi:hypothetical protein
MSMNKSLTLPFVLGILALVGPPPVVAQNADVAVVVSPNNAAAAVGLGELRKMFAGEKRNWPGGQQIKLIVRMPGARERTTMLKLLGLSEEDYKRYWTEQVVRGEVTNEPLGVPSIGMVLEALKIFPGAITLVDAHDVKPGMKVIKVDGHMPGEAGYPLH